MRGRRKLWLGAVVFAVLAAGWLLTRGPRAPAPTPPGSFSFAVLGDAPYFPWEDLQYRVVLQDLDAHDLRWVIHVGDIFWRPCTDEMYRRSLEAFNGLRHAVIFTPGDNEWADCWEPDSGAFSPLERLRRLRQIYFAEPSRSLGGNPIPLASQAGREAQAEFAEFVENARWSRDRTVLATLHLVGSHNAMQPFPARSTRDDAYVPLRTRAAAAWMRETFAEASRSRAEAVVLAFHANPDLEQPPEDPYRAAYEPFLEALEEEVEAFSGAVLLVHGDNHEFLVDRPLVRRTTGRRLENLTRLQVPGSPDVGWVRVVVTPGAAEPFAFEPRVVPRWKYW